MEQILLYMAKKNMFIFFLFAETAELFKKKRILYKNIIQCNIPYENLKKYLGYGYYETIIPGYYTPMPEFSIPIENFDLSSICDISNGIKEEWKRPDILLLYKSSIPREYLAKYESGSFKNGYDENSVLAFDLDGFINENMERTQNKL